MIDLNAAFAIAFLSLLNVFQFWWWVRTTQTLIDKLLSRNYADYVRTQQSLQQPAPLLPKGPTEDEIEQHDILKTLNSML